MKTTISHISSAIVAILLLQTLYYKFSASEESVYIFSTIGIEPWGRIGSGIAELIASILILIPKTRFVGAMMSVGIISGVILSHLTILGIEVLNDGGYLFFLSIIVLICSCITAYLDSSALKSIIISKIHKQ